jgi:hypothetical protein
VTVQAGYSYGDANLDGAVNEGDIAILSTHWGTSSGATWTDGDFNGDGCVDDRDASILASHWHESMEAQAPVVSPITPAPSTPNSPTIDASNTSTVTASTTSVWTTSNTSTLDTLNSEPAVPVAARFVGPVESSATSLVRRRIEPYRSVSRADTLTIAQLTPLAVAARDAALAAPMDPAALVECRLTWLSEFTEPRHRRPLVKPEAADVALLSYL